MARNRDGIRDRKPSFDVAHAERIAVAQEQDAEMRGLGSAAAPIEDSLRAMQRAWIPFRAAP